MSALFTAADTSTLSMFAHFPWLNKAFLDTAALEIAIAQNVFGIHMQEGDEMWTSLRSFCEQFSASQTLEPESAEPPTTEAKS